MTRELVLVPEKTSRSGQLSTLLAAGLCILISSVVLLGWVLGVEVLKAPRPDQVVMKTNAAVCFLMAGVVLLRRGRFGIVLACLVTLIGGLTMAEYALGIDLGIDQILCRESPGAFGTVHPNRMAPFAACCLLLLGPALVLVAAQRVAKLAQSLVLVAMATGIAVLVGHLHGVGPLQGPGGFTQMSPVAALETLIVGLGVLSATSTQGLMACLTEDTAGRAMARRLLPIALLPLIAGLLNEAGRRGGLFEAPFQAALDALIGTFLLIGFIWWTASWLHHVDLQRRRALVALLDAMATLEHRVSERTAELTESNAALQCEVAERRRTEDQLRTTEARFRSLVESTSTIVWNTPPSGEVAGELPSWSAFTGRPAELLQGRGWLESVHPDDREATVEAWTRATKEGTVYQIEHRVRDAQGVYHDMSVRGVPILDENGAIQEWVGAHTDITARRRAENDLRDREARLRAVVDTAVDSIITINAQGLIDSFNPAAESLFQFQAEEVLGRNVSMLMPSPYREEHDRYIDRYLSTGVTKVIGIGREVLGLRKDGSTFPLEIAVSQMNVQGEVMFTGILRNITERKKSDEQLRKLWRAVEQSLVSVIITDRDGLIEYVNPKFTEVTGYSFEEVRGQNPRFLKSGQTDAEVYETLWRTITNGGEWRGEFRNRKKNGELVWQSASISPVIDDRQVITHFVAVEEEITAAKQAQQLLESRARELARSNDELEQFAYVASHDLQEPLRMVASYLELLAERYEGQLDAKADKYIRYAVDGAARMKTLIDNLLEFSRLTSRGKPLEPVDLDAVLELAVKNLSKAIERTGAVVTHGTLPAVMGDSTQLVQLLQNLIGNAIKFCEGRAPKVHLEAQRRGGEWIVTVQDNGIGISPQYYERIFQIFQRLGSREKYAGTGMGLAICKKVVERHNGKIWVESRTGEGSTFSFTLAALREGGRGIDEPDPSAEPRTVSTVLLASSSAGERKELGHPSKDSRSSASGRTP
jgi:PAS domain S-box-containing protein